jgi:peptidoglycan/xylan/chitin deacetylase (PgdA/CDA1 family)
MVTVSRCLSILTYHRVTTEPDALFPDQVCAAEFDAQMRLLRRWFNVLPLAEAITRLGDGKLPARAACVTFDDGYEDNATVALPILLRHRLPATFFVSTGFLDGRNMWNDIAIEAIRAARRDGLDASCIGLGLLPTATIEQRRNSISTVLQSIKYLSPEERKARAEQLASLAGSSQQRLMLTRDQVLQLHRSGMHVGAHTVNHPILANISDERALAEIAGSKKTVEDIIDEPVALFAYPNGRPGVDYRGQHVRMLKSLGFLGAVSTAVGVSRRGNDPFQLPRFTPWDKNPAKFLMRLVRNCLRGRAPQVEGIA